MFPFRAVLHIFRNVGGNIRDGITGFSGSVMSKPKEFAHLIKNKFGSADNISQLSSKLIIYRVCMWLYTEHTEQIVLFLFEYHGKQKSVEGK